MKNGGMISLGFGNTMAGLAAIGLAAALLLVPGAYADDAQPGGRAVRLSFVEGNVQLSQGNQVLADQAIANTPLFEGTRVATADGGQAEIQFEDGSIARLSPNSSLTLAVLRGQDASAETEIALDGGLAYFELQSAGASGQMSIHFADSVLSATGFTVVRVDMDNPPGELAIFSGNAHLDRGSALSLDLHGGQSVALDASGSSQYKLSDTIASDSWDAWNADRDQALQAASAGQTDATQSQPNSNNPAWADLDANGNWYNVPGEGYVWSPTEAASPDWDPYGNGSWMWTPGYDYMWVSGYSWGYMPYQCGAWNYYDTFGWGWAPGGMCNPWWGGGGGWGPRIGHGPGGYRSPRRPGSGHGGPHRFDGPVIAGGRTPARPIIPVNRRLEGVSGYLPARDRNVPVVIAGHAIVPAAPVGVRPGTARPVFGARYTGNGASFANRGEPVTHGAPRINSVPARPPYNSAFSSGHTGVPARPAMPNSVTPGPNRPTLYTPWPSGNSGARPSQAPHSYTPPPSRPSGGSSPRPSGGSYGGGSHPSGGGGGGGGAHPSGGGPHR